MIMQRVIFRHFPILLVELVLCSCTVVTSQPDTVDLTVTYFSSHRRLELKSDPRRNKFSSLCTAHFAPVLRRFPLLHGSGARNWDIDLFLVLRYWDIEWRWHLLKNSRCWDVNLTSSRHRWLKYVNSHQALRWTQQYPDSLKPWERWDSRCRNRAQRTWESESQSRTHLAKTLTTGISHSTDTRVRSILPILPCCKQRDNHKQWWWRLHHTNNSLQHCCISSQYSQKIQKGARKVVRIAGNNGFEACRQLCLMFGTSDQTWKTVWTNFWNLWDDTMKRTAPIPFSIKWKKRAIFRTRKSLQSSRSSRFASLCVFLLPSLFVPRRAEKPRGRWVFDIQGSGSKFCVVVALLQCSGHSGAISQPPRNHCNHHRMHSVQIVVVVGRIKEATVALPSCGKQGRRCRRSPITDREVGESHRGPRRREPRGR